MKLKCHHDKKVVTRWLSSEHPDDGHSKHL